jgi:ABC-type transport system involved in cytochrome c biogenesis permease subunit
MNLRLFRIFTSLRLTVVLLVLSMMLVFMATLAQTRLGIWEVMSRYIRTFLVWVPVGTRDLPVFPGGWLLGGLLLINLIVAHASRFKWSWKKAPLIIIHGGLILLLLSEVITGLFARETQLTLDEGAACSYTEAPRQAELVIVDSSAREHDRVWSIPEKQLSAGRLIEHKTLPFRVKVHEFYQNSRVFLSESIAETSAPQATQGVGAKLRILEQPRVVTTDGRNIVSAVIELIGDGGPLGSWMVSTAINEPQRLEYNGRSYWIALRPERFYRPYSIQLIKFTHERHPGTEIPSRFASRVRLRNPEKNEDREVMISMNQPLRYEGETLYQASFANDDRTSILQVVRNPGWLLPYLACAMVGAGLILQFVSHVARSHRRNDSRRVLAARRAPVIGLATAVLAAAWLTSGLWHFSPRSAPDLDAFASLPVMADGRLKCFGTLARGALLTMSGKQTLTTAQGQRLDATEWLLTVLAQPEWADSYPIFALHHPDLLAMLGEPPGPKRVLAFNDLRKHGHSIREQADSARQLPREERSDFQRAVLKLDYAVTLYWRLRHSLSLGDSNALSLLLEHHQRDLQPIARRIRENPSTAVTDEQVGEIQKALVRYAASADLAHFRPIAYPHSNKTRGEWITVGESLIRSLGDDAMPPHVIAYNDIVRSFAANSNRQFNGHVYSLLTWLRAHFPEATRRAEVEAVFNRLDLFGKSIALYVAAFLALCVSWLAWPRTLRAMAIALLLVAFAGHTIGLLLRMYIQERPPVTSLYASAIFVGWAAVAAGLVLERIQRTGISATVAAIIGFLTLVIATNLGAEGDTVEVMRAVLDSNFWLATHVVVITIGYSATFLAGTLAAVGLIRGVNTTASVYGVTCFALLFSFVGTILGGIWADQSWGRFWGWDPKENGALLIVLWNAVLLHLRWGRLVSDRALMACTVFGNVITSFSWFGVNMLGVGLHSYGFMEGAPFWLGMFVLSQLAIMALAFVPRRNIDSAREAL